MPRSKPPSPPALEGLTYAECKPLAQLTLEAGISVLLRGHPGVGKSTLAADLARDMDLPLVDIRLAQRDPAELGGVYFPDRDAQVLSLFPPDWVRQACEGPVMVFLDEINAAVTRLHQAAAYQIVLEKRVGPFRFHPGTVVMAAGNLEEDNAIVTHLSSALCNRFAHHILRVDARTWLDWGAHHGIDEAILGFVGRYGEEVLYDNDGEVAFPTPRSWEMASRVYRAAPEPLRRRAIASCVGAPAAARLDAWLRIYRKVNAARIIRNGLAMDFRKGKKAEPSYVYAAIYAVAAWLNHEGRVEDAHLPNVVKFLHSPGLDPEYVFLFLRQIGHGSGVRDRLKPLPEYQALAGSLADLHAGLYS
jgi:hypothetical protein